MWHAPADSDRAVACILSPRHLDGELAFTEMYRWPESGLLEMDDAWIANAELVVVRSTCREACRGLWKMSSVTLPGK
jgi:hypothetical protein